jgi:capsular exopolysaccharide synthesis family protein
MLMRHKWFIVISVLAGIVIALLYIRSVVPIYQATASIRIDPGRAGSLGLADLANGGNGGSGDLIATEIAIIHSDAVAIDTLNSLSPAEFRQYTGMNKQSAVIQPGATNLTMAQEFMLGGFKANLSAASIPQTQLISISFRDPNPKTAATIVNHVIDAYIRQSFDSRYASVNEVTTWLTAQMDTLKDKATDAQRKLTQFQEDNNIITADTGGDKSAAPTDMTTGRLETLNGRLAQAQVDRILKEAQLRAANSGDPVVLASLYNDPTVTALLGEQTRLSAQYAQMSTKFGPNYPPLIDLRTQMRKVDDSFAKAIGNVKVHLRQEYDAAVTTQDLLQSQFDEQAKQAYAINRKQAEYSALRAEGASSRELYNTLQSKLQQASVEAGLNGVNTMRVDAARAPLFPVEPKKSAILTSGFMLGLFVGLAAAFLIEATSDKLQGIEQVENSLHYHLLAAIPNISLDKLTENGATLPTSGPSPLLVTYQNPQSREAEAYRSLRNAVLLSSMQNPPKTVLVTSTISGEGKSTTSANYSVVLAQKGARVLVIDADLRRPTLNKMFGADNKVGLSELILQEVETPNFRTPLPNLPGLTLLTAGKQVPLPSEALGSLRFYTLLQEWEKQFDYIIVDSAPLLIVSDTLPLAKWVDALVLVARYNVTPMSALRRVRDVLNRSDANVSGVVINDHPASKAGYYGGYGYGYYK